MVRLTGWVLLVAAQGLGTAQVLNNQFLTGKYYFRQISLGADAQGAIVDARSLLGSMTFDAVGRFTFTGQQTQGANAAAALSGSGAYSVDAAGMVTMDSPLRAGSKVN